MCIVYKAGKGIDKNDSVTTLGRMKFIFILAKLITVVQGVDCGRRAVGEEVACMF